MNIEDFRRFCLSLGDVTEKMPFGKFARRYDSILVFYVCGHMFCMIDIDDFRYVTVRSTEDEISDMQSRCASVGRPLNPSLKYWMQIDLDGDVSWKEILALVVRAYGLVESRHTSRR